MFTQCKTTVFLSFLSALIFRCVFVSITRFGSSLLYYAIGFFFFGSPSSRLSTLFCQLLLINSRYSSIIFFRSPWSYTIFNKCLEIYTSLPFKKDKNSAKLGYSPYNASGNAAILSLYLLILWSYDIFPPAKVTMAIWYPWYILFRP